VSFKKMDDSKDLKKEPESKLDQDKLDDSFLDIFEKEILESSKDTEKLNIENIATVDEYTLKIEEYIDNSDIDIDVNNIDENKLINDLDINLDNIDLSKIDLNKLKIEGLDVDKIKIGFDLNKLKLDDYKIDINKIDTDNIKFDNINLDLGSIISFTENINEIKKMNLLLTAPVKGFYGFFFINPYQELRNAFKKTYNQIIQLARPAEAFKNNLQSNEIIDAKDILEVQKDILKEEIINPIDKDIENTVQAELKAELGANWDKEETKKNQKKETKNIKTTNKFKNFIIFLYKSIRGSYLRLSLISFSAKLVIIVHSLFFVFTIYFLVKHFDIIVKTLWPKKQAVVIEDTSLLNLARKSLDHNKRLPGPVVSIDRILSTFQDTSNNVTKKIEISLYIELENHEVQNELYSISSRIKDKIISILGDENISKLIIPINKEHLKVKILQAINNELKQGKAISIYYKNFIIE